MITLILFGIGILIVGFLGLFIGWKIHPWTVGGMTQWVQSPLQLFAARLGTSIVCAIGAVIGAFALMDKHSPDFLASAIKSAESMDFSNPTPAPEAPPTEPEAVSLPVEVASVTPPPTHEVELKVDTVSHPEVETVPPTTPIIITSRVEPAPIPEPENETTQTPQQPSLATKIAELKGELAVVDAKIETERARWQAGIDTINRLTNSKKTPVREGSPQYHQCLQASRIIQEVEAGAPNLKAEKARLSAMIESLQNQ